MTIELKDRIMLLYDVREFKIHEYLNGNNTFSFSSIQLNIATSKENRILKNNDIYPFYVPIIAANFSEQIIKITVINNRKIVYTKSFVIDLQDAIKLKHITIFKSGKNIDKENNNPFLNYFIEELVITNENYALGLITIKERYSGIFYPFSEYYHRIFKDEIEKQKQANLKLSDELFFKKTWEFHCQRNNLEERIIRINNINFSWPLQPNNKNWSTSIFSKLIEMGLDNKLNAGLHLSGINLSKKKFGIHGKCHAYLVIGLDSFNSFGNPVYNIQFFEKDSGHTDFKTKDFWKDERFLIMLDKVLKSPVY